MARNEDVVKGFRTTSGIKKYDYAALENVPFGDNADGTTNKLDGKYTNGTTLSLEGNILTVTQPDGTQQQLTLTGKTYTLTATGNKITLTDSDGQKQEIDVKSLPDVTEADVGKILLVGSSGTWEKGDVPTVTVAGNVTQTGTNPVTGAGIYTFVTTEINNSISSALTTSY